MADSKAPAAAAPTKDAAAGAKGKDAPGGAKPNDPAAKGKDAGKGADAAKASGPRRNLKPIILAAAAVVLIGGGAAAFFLLRSPDTPDAAHADAGKTKGADGKPAGKEKEKKAEMAKPFFVEFEPFTVNLKDPEKFLQIKLTFQVKSDTTAEALKEMSPIVRSAVIPVLSSQDPAEIMTSEGKEKLSGEVVAAANKALGGGELDNAIDAALITHMIVQ